jgi:hypothetical protein
LNHGPQSISGLLNMTGYNLINLGALGVGTSTPSFPVDVENGYSSTPVVTASGGVSGGVAGGGGATGSNGGRLYADV